jgi:predicted permease
VPIFTLCPLVASYFGSATGGLGSVKDTVVQYIKSPIFIAVVAGIIFSQFPTIVHSQWLDPFWESMRMIQGTLTVIACLILGLQLRFSSVGTILPLFLVSAVIQIIIQPMIAGFGASLFDIALLDRQVLVLISAMPSAVLGTVFATQYNCDGQKASELVFLNILASLIGIPLVFYSLFH